jgi:hypothetical protein
MATTGTRETRLSDEQLAQAMELARGSDSVELKLTVPETDQRSTVAALDMDPLNAEIRQVFFFDTPDLVLSDHGVVVRLRRVQKKGDDSVVKLRPVVPSDLPASVRKLPEFGVEVDAMPGGFVCSASMKGSPAKDVRRSFTKSQPLRKLFSKEQREFYAEHAPDGLALDDLTLLGPIFVLKLKFTPKAFDRKLVAEMWLYPDNSRILELSTKCAPADALRVAEEARAFLSDRGVDLGGEQETKTRKALQYFSRQHKASAPAT